MARVLDAGLPQAWVVVDTVYGHSAALRPWREDQKQSYVLAVPAHE